MDTIVTEKFVGMKNGTARTAFGQGSQPLISIMTVGGLHYS